MLTIGARLEKINVRLRTPIWIVTLHVKQKEIKHVLRRYFMIRSSNTTFSRSPFYGIFLLALRASQEHSAFNKSERNFPGNSIKHFLCVHESLYESNSWKLLFGPDKKFVSGGNSSCVCSTLRSVLCDGWKGARHSMNWRTFT